MLFWANFTLKYKANDIWTNFFLCLEYFTGKISWISLNIDVLETLKRHFNLKYLYNKTIFWRLHAIVRRSKCISFVCKMHLNTFLKSRIYVLKAYFSKKPTKKFFSLLGGKIEFEFYEFYEFYAFYEFYYIKFKFNFSAKKTKDFFLVGFLEK